MKKLFLLILLSVVATVATFTSCKKHETFIAPTPSPPLPSPPPQPVDANLRLIPFGALSQGRSGMLAASAGNKILFVGGRYLVPKCYYDSSDGFWSDCMFTSTRVDIYDTSAQSWSIAELAGSEYSDWSNAVSVGDKIFFAGGYRESGRIDIYNASSNSWSTAELPEPRYDMAVVSLGSKVYFAGGNKVGAGASDRVDIFDSFTTSWSSATLSEARSILSATVVGDKILFAGGNRLAATSDRVDIYDVPSNSWSSSTLSQARERPTAITLGNKAFFAGGNIGTAQYLSPVDIYDNTTQSWSATSIPFGTMFFNAVVFGDKILFFTLVNANWVNVFDASLNSWSVAHLNQRIINPAVITVGSQVYVAGGSLDDGTQSQTKQVWRLQF